VSAAPAAAPPHVLVVAEVKDGRASRLTCEVLGLAAFGEAQPVAAVLFAPEAEAAAELVAAGADRVYHVRTSSDRYEAELWLPYLQALARDLGPQAIWAGHTPAGADLAPRLAARLEAGVATACVEVRVDSGAYHYTRPCYGGNARETITFPDAPSVATLRAGVGTVRSDLGRHGEVTAVAARTVQPRVRVIAREHEPAAAMKLEDARVVVAGGRGLGGPEGFRLLEALAGVLGGVVGASRVPCDLGWCPHSWQIGLTGRSVTPDLYFAVGISGAGHHLAGCGNSKAIVAINTDPDAAIFREARFGVIGDYREILPPLATALADLRNKETE
jgi:electron transfer flavoprotein alpha subunit